MSARRATRPRKRDKRERHAALPFVQANPTLTEEHARLLGEGYQLRAFLGVRIDRRTMKASVEVQWRKREPEMGPKAHRTFSHYFTIDLRKHAGSNATRAPQ